MGRGRQGGPRDPHCTCASVAREGCRRGRSPGRDCPEEQSGSSYTAPTLSGQALRLVYADLRRLPQRPCGVSGNSPALAFDQLDPDHAADRADRGEGRREQGVGRLARARRRPRSRCRGTTNPSPWAQPKSIVSVSNPGSSQKTIRPLKIASSIQESTLHPDEERAPAPACAGAGHRRARRRG